jgi:hypothetical protein
MIELIDWMGEFSLARLYIQLHFQFNWTVNKQQTYTSDYIPRQQ